MATLLLIPGLAADAAMWSAQQAALTAWRPVVTDVHMREETLAAMATTLLCEHPGPLVLCGASMGGMIALEAARQAPERVAGLALLGTDAGPDPERMVAIREAAIALFAQSKVREVVEPNVAMALHPDHAPRLAQPYLEMVLRAGAQQLIRQNRAVIGRADQRPHLPTLRCPVLVLCGEDDRLQPPERSREIADAVPNARLRLIPRCGHMLTMEQPEIVNAALLEWLETLSLRP